MTEMHALNMTVHPFTLIDDKSVYQMSDVTVTKMMAMKGIDGIYTDFPLSTWSSFQLIGS